jgi:hypothetical protein
MCRIALPADFVKKIAVLEINAILIGRKWKNNPPSWEKAISPEERLTDF